MDFNFQEKIESLLKSRNSTKKELYDYLGITRQGFDDKLKHNRFTANELGKVAEYFAIDVADFYRSANKSSDGGTFGQEVLNKVVEEIKSQYEARIEELKETVSDLREQLKFNREMVQDFKDGRLGKSEGAPLGQIVTGLYVPNSVFGFIR